MTEISPNIESKALSTAFSIADEHFNIRKIELRCIEPIKLPRPFYDATMGPFSFYEACFLRLIDSDGMIGECEYPRGGIRYLKDFFIPILLEAGSIPYGDLYNKLFWSIRNEGFRGSAAQALGHLDRVFYDLAATRRNLPLHQYLGGTINEVVAYASGGGINIKGNELIDECLSWEGEGYGIIKIKFGSLKSSISDDVKRIQSVREALQKKTRLAIDANQSMNLSKAKLLVKELEHLDIEWLEEPILAASIHEIKTLCEVSKIKIAYGESERSASVFPSIVAAGVTHLQPIAGHINSIKDWMEIVKLAQKEKLDFSSGGTSFINCTFIAAAGRSALLEFLKPILQPLEDIFIEPLTIKKGRFSLSQAPGIGISVDWKRLEKEKRISSHQVWG